jgi:hypothetical protein
MAGYAKVEFDRRAFYQVDLHLLRLPLEIRSKLLPRVLRSTGKIVVQAVSKGLQEQLNSELTGSRDKQSKALRISRPDHHLYEAVIVKTAGYGQSEIAVVGPSWPGGNLVNFYVSEHVHMLWGRDAGKRSRPTATDVMAGAIANTRGIQETHFVNELRRLSDVELKKLKAGQ